MISVTITDTVSIASIPAAISDKVEAAFAFAETLRHQYATDLDLHKAAMAGIAARIEVAVVDTDAEDIGDRPLIGITGTVKHESKVRQRVLDHLSKKAEIHDFFFATYKEQIEA